MLALSLVNVFARAFKPCVFRTSRLRLPAMKMQRSHSKSIGLRTYRKRSSGQDDRPESRLGDEGSLCGALLRNVARAREHKCFMLRTYKKAVYNPCRMNTYET